MAFVPVSVNWAEIFREASQCGAVGRKPSKVAISCAISGDKYPYVMYFQGWFPLILLGVPILF